MKYYQFKTFRTTYYFPTVTDECQWLYGLYHPYGSWMIKCYWWLFTNCRLLRMLHSVDSSEFDFPYQNIMNYCPTNSIVSFNMGTPGDEQKISMLGYDPTTKTDFFAKYSTKKIAKELSRNEIRVLKGLAETDLTPILLSSYDNDREVFFSTSRVKGQVYTTFELTDYILSLLVYMSKITIDEHKIGVCLSHGDFCPWNMLWQDDGTIRLIDWEMAADRPLGYDLFMFIIHAQLIMGRTTQDILEVFTENKNKIMRYFSSLGIEDYTPFLCAFINIRLEEEHNKGNIRLCACYRELRLKLANN